MAQFLKPASSKWTILSRKQFYLCRALLYLAITGCILWYLLFPGFSSADSPSTGQLPDRELTRPSFSKTVEKNPKICEQTYDLVNSLVGETTTTTKVLRDENGRPNNTGWVGANRLLDEDCWTYKNRYGHYHDLPAGFSFHNKCHKHLQQQSSTAFVIRMAESQVWSDDLILSIRAVVSEVGWKKGFDVFILQHIEDPQSFDKSSVPFEFRPYTIQFTDSEVIKDYDPTVFYAINDPPQGLSRIAQYNHMAETFFMRAQGNQHYKFAWFAEVDLRSMGRWDKYLDKVVESIERNAPSDKTMDLVNFGPSYHATLDWAWGKSLKQFPPQDFTMSLLQLHRVSRSLVDTMHKFHKKGFNAYFEGFPTTVATTSGLNRFTFVNPVFSNGTEPFTGDPFTGIADVDIDGDRLQKKNLWMGNFEDFPPNSSRLLYHGTTYCPLANFSKGYYNQWMEDENVCRPASLVHPVK